MYQYSSIKKSHTMNGKNKQVTECIREFKLRQQYPSMIKKPKNVGKMVVINASLESLIPMTTKLTSKTNIQVKNGFRKLRLKLPNGKDLGECNVQILPSNNDMLKGKTVTIVNQNRYEKLNKSMILSNKVSENKTKKMVTIVPLQSMNSIQKNVFVSSNEVSCNVKNNNVDAKDNNMKYQSKIISLKGIIPTDQYHEGKKNTGTENMDTDIITDNRSNNENEGSRHNNIQSKLPQNYDNLKDIIVNTNSLEEMSKYLSYSEVEKTTNTNNSTFPLIEVSSHLVNIPGMVPKTAEQNSNTDNSGSQNGSLLNAKKELYFLPMIDDGSVNLFLEHKSNAIDLNSDNYNLAQQIVNTTSNKSTPEHNKIIRENVMVIVHHNGTSLLDNGIGAKHEINGTSVNNKNHDAHTDYTPIVTVTSNYENVKSQTALQNVDNPFKEDHTDENVLLQKIYSSCSVLKDVIGSIKNKNLKAKALKALAHCDIGIEQQLLSDLSKDTKTVCDTKVQTDVNSLVEAENFLNVKKDIPEELYFANVSENSNVNPVNYMAFYENPIFSPFSQSQMSDTFLEKCISGNIIDDICNKHSAANKVKEVLSQPNVSCNKISEQLRRDFETVRKWDENGMLNIHKAVISNRMYDVQRHLMVLKACNVNVDTPTQSGMTSLELAIKHNASTEIVKLLLKAGANPASFQPIHDSALILASKGNHPLLSKLTHHVPSNKLLDHMDFTGFAALHYCAQCGNLEGVSSLINMGANVNLQESRSGRTPLFLAIENNHPVIAQKLIKSGAQSDIPNFSGQTVMSLVDKINHLSLITLLHTNR